MRPPRERVRPGGAALQRLMSVFRGEVVGEELPPGRHGLRRTGFGNRFEGAWAGVE